MIQIFIAPLKSAVSISTDWKGNTDVQSPDASSNSCPSPLPRPPLKKNINNCNTVPSHSVCKLTSF